MEGLPRYVAGVDLSPPDAYGSAVGAVVLLKLPELQIVEVKVYEGKPVFPYVQGCCPFGRLP